MRPIEFTETLLKIAFVLWLIGEWPLRSAITRIASSRVERDRWLSFVNLASFLLDVLSE